MSSGSAERPEGASCASARSAKYISPGFSLLPAVKRPDDIICRVGFEEFQLTVDAAIFKVGKVLLVKRATEPFRGKWVLPGGMVSIGETLEQAVAREAREETGMKVRVLKLSGAYSALRRDPRRRSVSVAFVCEPLGEPKARTPEADEIRWFAPTRLPPMGFDHRRIVKDAAAFSLEGMDVGWHDVGRARPTSRGVNVKGSRPLGIQKKPHGTS